MRLDNDVAHVPSEQRRRHDAGRAMVRRAGPEGDVGGKYRQRPLAVPRRIDEVLIQLERVSRGKSYITVDAYHNDEERKKMFEWNLTGRTIMHVDEWKAFFKMVGYTGDYFWFIP